MLIDISTTTLSFEYFFFLISDLIFRWQQETHTRTRNSIAGCQVPPFSSFLGGLSLHLNHLIASRVANYDWPFGTLPFILFCSNLDTRDLETYPRT